MSQEIIINDDNWQAHVDAARENGNGFGLEQRDFNEFNVGYMAGVAEFPDELLIPESEWEHLLAKQIEAKAQLSEIRNHGNFGQPMDTIVQGSWGFCWAHSVAHAVALVRAVNNQPYVPLSAFAIASIIKGYRDRGGFCNQALELIRTMGIPSQELWPQGKVDRRLDTPDMRANAALHVCTEWWDFSDNKSKRKAQMVSCLLRGIPVPTDVMWWGHSICTMDLVSVRPFKTRIWNSWSDWGNNGTGILEGDKAIPDNAVAPRVLTAATN